MLAATSLKPYLKKSEMTLPCLGRRVMAYQCGIDPTMVTLMSRSVVTTLCKKNFRQMDVEKDRSYQRLDMGWNPSFGCHLHKGFGWWFKHGNH
jgi:hypothetical protein